MQELIIAQKGLEDLWASRAGDRQHVWSFLGQADTTVPSFGFSPIRGETRHLKPPSYIPFWTRQGGKYPSWRRSLAAAWRRKAAL
jgi:hypothetical protein